MSAPKDADIAGLRQVVADAKHKGIDLKVVVVPQNPPIDTPLRDVASDVGHAYPGSTVLVISPMWAGTYSPNYDRVTSGSRARMWPKPGVTRFSQRRISSVNCRRPASPGQR